MASSLKSDDLWLFWNRKRWIPLLFSFCVKFGDHRTYHHIPNFIILTLLCSECILEFLRDSNFERRKTKQFQSIFKWVESMSQNPKYPEKACYFQVKP